MYGRSIYYSSVYINSALLIAPIITGIYKHLPILCLKSKCIKEIIVKFKGKDEGKNIYYWLYWESTAAKQDPEAIF